jgi:hypothetical protein
MFETFCGVEGKEKMNTLASLVTLVIEVSGYEIDLLNWVA